MFLTFIVASFAASGASADNFNPNYIISDTEMLNYTAVDKDFIQNFLESKNSYLADYVTQNAYGSTKPASEIIYDAAVNNYDCDGVALSSNPTEVERKLKCKKITTVNPKFLLVLLQKEQSLIEEPSPTQRQLNWATGYGCPDGASCNTRWEGFGKQVNSAALQFKDYLDNPQYYTYRAGQTYTFNNSYSTIKEEKSVVTPANQATAALYNYTPHVYNGNYNFYKLWNRYFSVSFLDGTLLQAAGEPGVWLLQNGKKRPFTTKGALTSRFNINKIITVNKSDLDSYEKGAPIKFSNYSLVRSPMGNIYLIVDDKRRGFSSSEAFRKIGFNPEEVVDASWEDISTYAEGAPITEASKYPTGALLQDSKTGGVYWITEDKKAPIWDAVFLKTKFKNKKIIQTTPEELANYETIDPVIFDDGELVKSPHTSDVYIIANGKKHPIKSGELFESLGYKWENVITASSKVLYLYDIGETITDETI